MILWFCENASDCQYTELCHCYLLTVGMSISCTLLHSSSSSCSWLCCCRQAHRAAEKELCEQNFIKKSIFTTECGRQNFTVIICFSSQKIQWETTSSRDKIQSHATWQLRSHEYLVTSTLGAEMSIQAKALLLPSSTHASSLSTCFVVRPHLLEGVFYKRKLHATLWKEVNTYRYITQTASNCPEEQAMNTAQLDFILTFPIAYFDHSQCSWSQVVSVLQFIIGVFFCLFVFWHITEIV